MKKIFAGLLLCILLFGGFFCVSMYNWLQSRTVIRGNDLSLNIRESDDLYQIYAKYNPRYTSRVQNYLDETLGAKHFHNARISGDVVLDDQTRFFIRSAPGKLVIRFDRDNNSEAAFIRMKELGRGLKQYMGGEM